MENIPLVYGKYQLLTRLAKGSLAEVWKARSHGVEGFEKILVVKRFLPALSEQPRFVELFAEEAKVALMLTHSNIAQVFDLGHVDGSYFIAMEYVKGPDLGAALGWCRRKRGAVPEELAVYIVSELAKGLDYAHRRRDAELRPLHIVHRDVSPENVLLSYEGEVKLTDFGLARARESALSFAELAPAKYAYLAPEQARREPLDARTDVYALGVILYEALTGTRVLDIESPRDTLARARRGEALDLTRLAGACAPALYAIVARAAAPAPGARHANAGELYEALIELLFESGRRVGALELSRWLEELASSAAGVSAQEVLGPISGLEEIFGDQPTQANVATAAPAESFLARTLDAFAEVQRSSFPARAEWRDVSVLLVDGVELGELRTFAARFGGEQANGKGTHGPGLLFGLGEAAGHDVQAAARCALALLRAHEKLRAVVHSGRVLLDSEGQADEASRESLRGEAARWLKRARKGEVLASPAAAALLGERFELSAAHAQGVRAIERERRPHEGVGKFTGRRDELRAVGEVFATANRGELRVLAIQGEAGFGKSRLIVEIERRLHNAGHDVGFYVASCSPQGRAMPFFAIQEQVRAVLGLEDLESPARLSEQTERLRLLGLSPEQREAVARLLGANTPLGAHTGKLETALMRLAYKLAQDRLSVFVWDSAEFMDSASRELVMKLLSNPFSARAVVIFAHRPAEPGPWVGLPNFEQVVLGPLADDEVARLIRHRLGGSEVDGGLVREVNLKTGGNPLFVEELLVAMREQGAVQVEDGVARLVAAPASAGERNAFESRAPVELPRTLRGLVAARVGKLPGPERLILQLAVTFGSRFSPELLAHASEQDEVTVRQALTLLSERDLVRMVGPGEYALAHELVREVLYSAIQLEQRPSLHAAVARAIETLLPIELDAAVERLAYHYREAGQWDKAIRFLTRAGERYEAEHALPAAIEAYTQVIELSSRTKGEDRATVLALHARIGELAFHTRASELAAERMAAASELAESWGEEAYVARFAMLRGRLLNKASRFREGRLWLERAQAIARRLQDRALERDVALAAAEAHERNGEYTAVVRYVGDALEISRASGDRGAEVRGLLLLAPAYAAIGELERAREALARLEQLLAGRAERPIEVELERVRSSVLEAAGERSAACEAARRALELAKEYDLPHEQAVIAHHLGGLYLRGDEEKRAFAALRLSYEVSTEHGFARLQWRNVGLLGFLDALRFDSEQGYSRMQQAVQYAHERGYVLDLIEQKYLLAMVEQKRSAHDRARSLLHEVIDLADPHGHVRVCDDAEQALRALEGDRPIALPR